MNIARYGAGLPAVATIYSCCLLSTGSYFDIGTHCNVQIVINGCIFHRSLYFICKVLIGSSVICAPLAKHVIVLSERKILPMPKKILSGQ